jgi:hypothetical protein
LGRTLHSFQTAKKAKKMLGTENMTERQMLLHVLKLSMEEDATPPLSCEILTDAKVTALGDSTNKELPQQNPKTQTKGNKIKTTQVDLENICEQVQNLSLKSAKVNPCGRQRRARVAPERFEAVDSCEHNRRSNGTVLKENTILQKRNHRKKRSATKQAKTTDTWVSIVDVPAELLADVDSPQIDARSTNMPVLELEMPVVIDLEKKRNHDCRVSGSHSPTSSDCNSGKAVNT